MLPKPGKGFIYKIMESGGTLATQLYLSMSKAQYDVAFGIAVVLLCIVFVINFAVNILAGKLDMIEKE